MSLDYRSWSMERTIRGLGGGTIASISGRTKYGDIDESVDRWAAWEARRPVHHRTWQEPWEDYSFSIVMAE